MIVAGFGDLHRLDHECLGDLTLEGITILEPLILNDRRAAGTDTELEPVSDDQLTCPRLGGDLNRQD